MSPCFPAIKPKSLYQLTLVTRTHHMLCQGREIQLMTTTVITDSVFHFLYLSHYC
jgi:hypothetical protein